MTRLFPLLLIALLWAGPAWADNVDLVTLPGREGVQLTIYNSEDLTLVRERRHVTVKRGANRLQFSWANTLIDPSSVELRPVEHVGEVEIVDTVFPGQKPQFLIWNVESAFEGQLLVEVSYFTSGLTWAMDYVGQVDPDEERMDFRGYVRVSNASGEAYENAQVRLIVGRINLIEKIADLARRQGIPVPGPQTPAAARLRRDASLDAFAKAEFAEGMREPSDPTPPGIVKEGVSEYFMFTVEGVQTVPHGWSRRIQALRAPSAAFDIVYRMRAHQYGPRPVRFFLWKNTEAHGLGESPLPDGRVRLFRDNGREGLSYLGEQIVRYVPIQAAIEVNTGPDDLVVYETRRTRTERFNFTFHHNAVVGWDTRTQWLDTIRNYRGKPVVFELHRQWPGHVEYRSETKSTLFDYQTVQATFTLAPRERVPYVADVLVHEGRNKTQDAVVLR